MKFNAKIIMIILLFIVILFGVYLVKKNIDKKIYLENEAFYDKIDMNMTQGDVLDLIGREPPEIIFNDGGDYGTLECWYYEPLFMCFAEGEIVSKSGAKL